MGGDLEEIYHRHADSIYRYLLRVTGDRCTAEDLTQETFFRAIKGLNFWRGDYIRPWLFKVAYHLFIDEYRKLKRKSDVALHPQYHRFPGENETEQQWLQAELRQEISERIGKLPMKQQQVLILFYYHQLSLQEISDILNISRNDVKISLYRSRRQLRQQWEGEVHGRENE